MELRKILDSSDYLLHRPTEAACVDALDQFLRSNSADLSKCTSINAATAARWGQPLLFLPELYADPYVTRFVDTFSGNATLNEDSFAELQALALMKAMGCTEVRIIGRTSEKSHDFDASWGDERIEIEVTRAGPKDANVILAQQTEAIAQLLYVESRKFDLILHISRRLDDDEIEQLKAASSDLKPGEITTSGDTWHLAGEEIRREPGVIVKVGESHALPTWWRRGMCMFHIHAILQSDEVPSPRVKVNWPVVYDGYLNPAKKKAQKFQGTAQRAYVVAIDVTNLPNAFTNFDGGLQASFPNWKRVSAVLLFENHKSAEKIGWNIQLFKNPAANHPLREGQGGIGDLASTQLILAIEVPKQSE